MLSAVQTAAACSLRSATTSSSARAVLGARRCLATDAAPVLSLLDGLTSISASSSQPPAAGPGGYPPAKAPNPFNTRDSKAYLVPTKHYSLYCQSTRNNTITTLMDHNYEALASFTGGSCGFKKANRASYEAGYQCAVRMFKEIERLVEKEKRDFVVDLYFNGFGQGRDAMHRALLTTEGEKLRPLVVSLTDRTPIKIGGTRAKKARRL
ncbi:hypothetical protein DXG03_003482 [Asterophora parasitica]|uniref:Uncharacterized protein n=1 Tax=Asterophora parasitica TaxID=117018 RepID=A0A9P7GFZ5_9AGAR|nr:hypothetical protein DXG03_003482 [Asterophora parasitica]